MYFPVLPLKVNGKLLFVLCYSCAMEQKSRCDNSDEECVLTGVWCSLEMGYEIMKVYEVYKYESNDDIFL